MSKNLIVNAQMVWLECFGKYFTIVKPQNLRLWYVVVNCQLVFCTFVQIVAKVNCESQAECFQREHLVKFFMFLCVLSMYLHI